jgi:hypothetical protein
MISFCDMGSVCVTMFRARRNKLAKPNIWDTEIYKQKDELPERLVKDKEIKQALTYAYKPLHNVPVERLAAMPT